MMEGYVKGGSFVKWKMCLDSMPSTQMASPGGFSLGWLPMAGSPGFLRGIHLGQIVIPQVPDIESFFQTAPAKWLRGGFPGEKARRYRNAALRPPVYDQGRGGTRGRGSSTYSVNSP